MYTSDNLAKAIKKQAQCQGISIKELLEECDLGSNTMSALYHGKAMAFDSLAKIADVLECSVDLLLGRTTAIYEQDENSTDEQKLIVAYRKLTDEGQRAVLTFAEYATTNPQYQKYTDIPKEA